MTQEEKAKAYDELKVKAQELEEDGCFDKITLFDLFPELKESEDEKIRKAIIDHIRHSAHNIPADKFNTWIAWLEKQDLKFKVGDLIINKDGNGKVKQILEATNSGYTTNDGFAIREIYDKNYRTCEIKDICQWKPSDEQIKTLEDSIEFLGCTKKVRDNLKSLYNDLKKLREE